MLVDEKIKINISYKNITHYIKLGYKAYLHQELEINTIDLPKSSHVKINAKCELCGTEILLYYYKYTENKNRHGFYGCKRCSRSKAAQTMLDRYGVTNVTMLDEVKEKIKQTCLEKYGETTNLKHKDTIDKRSETMIRLYGTDKFHLLRDNVDNEFDKPYKNKNKIKEFISKENDIIDPIIKYDNTQVTNTYTKYKNEVNRLTKLNYKKIYDEWDGIDFYDDENIKKYISLDFNDHRYPTIDHKISINYGFKNNILPIDIANISNLCITKRGINAKKRDLNYDQFIEKLNSEKGLDNI